MKKTFQGRVVAPGQVTAPALVSHGGLNTLPQTIGSTTGGLVLYCACSMGRNPACMLFSEPIDSLAAAGAILSDVWLADKTMPVIDSLGEEFLAYIKDGMTVTVSANGLVTVE